MAEARSAIEAPKVLFSYSDDGVLLRIDRGAIPHLFTSARRAVQRSLYDTRNAILNGVWPAQPAHWIGLVSSTAALMLYEHPILSPVRDVMWKAEKYVPWWPQGTTKVGKAFTIAAVAGTTFFLVGSYVRRYILRALLGYKGYLYMDPKKTSWKVTVWGILLKLFTGPQPMLYGFQNSLPRLPVPSLKETIDRYLRSIHPLVDEAEYASVCKLAENFLKNEGPRLQRYLHLKSWLAPNYVTDWWEKYVYLQGRSSIMINSNYYVIDSAHHKESSNQTSRAALVIHQMMLFKKQLDDETLKPFFIRGSVPMCMSQYKRMFSTTRVPGKECDTLVHLNPTSSKHIVVLRNGKYYYMSLFHVDAYDTPLTASEIESQLEWIVKDADSTPAPTDGEAEVAALTSWGRTEWAEAREKHFDEGTNRASLDLIESAIFVVVIEDELSGYDEESGSLDLMGKKLIHGNGTNRWFDKSINLVVFKDGKVGLNVEHSWADAPVIAHMMEWSLCTENRTGYDEHGRVKKEATGKPLPAPRQLRWLMNGEIRETINTALEAAKVAINDFDLKILEHGAYGKGFMKKCRVSPDAYIQMAMQLAYFKQNKRFALTYESSMTRLFKDGRTETVRPLSDESAAFVKSMFDSYKSSKERIALLNKAADKHQNTYRDAMSGKGIDRHLFALYVVSKGLGIDSELLKNALGRPWRLSTSQQPQQQTDLWNLDDPNDLARVSPGGGFGPVADDGYGVSYMIAGENLIFFHISSKKSCAETDSRRFAALLQESLAEMKALYQEA
eukprot:Colp12_sorted_trinity150504_noHs@9833